MLTIHAIFKFSSNLLVGWGGDILALVCLGLSVAFGCFVYSAFEKPVSVGLKNISTVRTWLPRIRLSEGSRLLGFSDCARRLIWAKWWGEGYASQQVICTI
jgi:hypothetical protein